MSATKNETVEQLVIQSRDMSDYGVTFDAFKSAYAAQYPEITEAEWGAVQARYGK